MPSLTSVLDNVKPAGLGVVAAFVVGHLALKAWFFSAHYYDVVAWPLTVATGGAITPVALAALVELIVLVIGVMLFAGRLHWRDLGLRPAGLVNAALVLLVLWGVVNAVTVAKGMQSCCTLDVGPMLSVAPMVGVGKMLDAFWGSGFIEEVMYRGFLLPQVYLIARAAGVSPTKALVLAIVGTQVYFGLNHIPAATRMHMDFGLGAVYIVHATLVGGLFAALYLRTGNLFIAIGAHALINNPAALYVSGVDPSLLMLIGVSVLLLGWPYFHRLLGDVFTLAGAEAEPRAASA